MLHLRYLFVVLSVSALGCSTLQGFLFPNALEKSTQVSWEKDLKIQVNDRVYYGTAVVPLKDSYNIYVFPPYEEITRLQWRTCHRGGVAKDAVQYGRWPWSKNDKFFKLEFKPMDIERERACTLSIEALAMKNKVMGFGMIVFPDKRPWFELPATLECNGQIVKYDGTSVCQAPVGAITRINLGPDVFHDDAENSNCPPFKDKGSGVYEFQMPKDECIYNFKKAERDEEGRLKSHKLITFGYELSPPPED
jgi:hypothetical protein